MKTISIAVGIFAALLLLLSGIAQAEMDKVVSATGKVTAVEAGGIVIDWKVGNETLTVGVIVQPETTLMVKGKTVPIADLEKSVSVGDTVTLKYVKSTDLYGKQVVKK
jgi:hypothetical protein